MQKACLLFTLLASIPGISFAQPSELCRSFGALMEESYTKFSGMVGSELVSQNNYKRTASTFEVKNASSCYIETSSVDTYWYAEYGSFGSLEEAKVKIKSLQLEFTACFPGVEFVERINNATFLPLYDFKETTTYGINFLKAEFGIYRSNDEKFIAFFRMPENAGTLHYFNISNEPGTSAFAKGISQLISAASSGFKNILGRPVLDGTFLKTYQSNYCLPGALDCEIEEVAVFKHYKACFSRNVAATVVETELQKLADYVSSSLGKKYMWCSIENGFGFIESTNASVFYSPLIEVIKEKEKGNKFNILIRVNEQTKY